MPRQGNGTYVLPAGNPVTPSTLIRSEWANSTLTDIANALSQSLSKDGQTVPSADLPMGGFKHTNVAKATAVGQYAETRQVQNSELLRLVDTAGSTSTAYVATLILGSNSWDDGVTFLWKPLITNTGPATITINGSAAETILNGAGQPLAAGDMTAGNSYFIRKLGLNWLLLPFASVGGTGDYVLKTGDTMSGPLTIGSLSGQDASLTVVPYTGQVGRIGVGVASRQGYNIDAYNAVGDMLVAFQNGVQNQAFRLRVTSSNYILDCKPLDASGLVPATPSFGSFLLQMNDAAGVNFNAFVVDTQGSITANYRVNGRMFRATHFETALSAGAVNLDFAQYQSWSLTLGGDTQFTLANVAVGFVARVNLRSTQGRTVTWAAGSDTIYWPNSSGNLPPNSTEIGAGPLDMCLFTFFKIASGVILAQWSAY